MPVQLSQFTGKASGCNIILNWTSETEETFNEYELQRSGDGRDFTTIKRIKGEGGATSKSYQYQDELAGSDNYYRLRMNDQDGSFEYSKIIHIKTDCENEHDMICLLYTSPSPRDS